MDQQCPFTVYIKQMCWSYVRHKEHKSNIRNLNIHKPVGGALYSMHTVADLKAAKKSKPTHLQRGYTNVISGTHSFTRYIPFKTLSFHSYLIQLYVLI